MIRNSEQAWGIVSQAFHWVIAPLVLVQLGLGIVSAGLPSPTRLLGIHVSIGVVIWVLMAARLLWRLMNKVPVLPDTLTREQKRVARVNHAAFYVLILIQPFTGLLLANATGLPVQVLGWRVPMIFPQTQAMISTGFFLHVIGAAGLLLSILLHVPGALRHEFVLRDNVLRRMVPGMGNRSERLPRPKARHS